MPLSGEGKVQMGPGPEDDLTGPMGPSCPNKQGCIRIMALEA